MPFLHHAYPVKTDRASVDQVIGTINTVRNRIAHHEPIFDRPKNPEQEPDKVHSELMRVLRMLNPEVAQHLGPTSTVQAVLALKP